MSKKQNATQVAQNESVNAVNNNDIQQVINAINAEAKSLGAIIRNFVAVAKDNATALYMLETILGHPFIVDEKETPTNDIRQAIITAFPYVKDGTMLHKVNGLFTPYTQYSADIIKKSFYNAVGATKVKTDFTPATEDEIAAAKEQAEKKKEERAEKRAAKKANEEMLAKFFEEMMQATEDTCWDIVCKYKAATTATETSEEQA